MGRSLTVRPLVILIFSTRILFFAPSSGVAAETAKNVELVIENLQKRYESTKDFVADFLQETEIQALNRRVKARGKLYFKRPGKMLWHYDEPKGEWLLADGKNLYYYQPGQGQVIKSPLKNSFQSDIPLSFLFGIGNLRRDFKLTLKGFEQGDYILSLAPKGEPAALSEILLGVESQGFDILWARILDSVGNVNTVRFSNLRRGVGLKDSLFRLQVPAGADMVELGP